MGDKRASRDRLVARIAARQHGVISIGQLAEAGIARQGAYKRARIGRLHRVHIGVYAVGHSGLGKEGRWMAAVLACGEGAALSHRSAAELWGLLPTGRGPVHVTVPGYGGRRRRKGIRLHRSCTLTAEQTGRRLNIPLTCPVRTLADLRGAVPPAELRRAIRQAEVMGLPLGNAGEPDGTRSELERAFLALARRHRLPAPTVNARVGPMTVDFLWPDRRLIVETDGYRYHRGRQAFEDDRARDLELRRRGYQVLRFSYVQVVEQSAVIADTLRELLED
jgi:very-short-patch-repair endonuclease